MGVVTGEVKGWHRVYESWIDNQNVRIDDVIGRKVWVEYPASENEEKASRCFQ